MAHGDRRIDESGRCDRRQNAPEHSVERRLALAGLGLVRAPCHGSLLTTAEAAQEIVQWSDLSPAARDGVFAAELIRFLEWGMELDDVKQLAKGGLEESYREMERLLLRSVDGTALKNKVRQPKTEKTLKLPLGNPHVGRTTRFRRGRRLDPNSKLGEEPRRGVPLHTKILIGLVVGIVPGSWPTISGRVPAGSAGPDG